MHKSGPESCHALPLAFVAVQDENRRRDIAAALRVDGWRVAELPSGFHLVRELADGILERNPPLRPQLIVVDAISVGCTGMSVADGLADIGWQTPVILLTTENTGSLIRARAAEQQVFMRARGPMSALTQLARRFRRAGMESERQAGISPQLR